MHLTRDGILAGLAIVLAVGVLVGWGAGRAFQRAADAYGRFRRHVRMTSEIFRSARYAAGDAAGTVLLAGLVVAVGVAVVLAALH